MLPRQPSHGAGSRAAGSSLRFTDVSPPGQQRERDGKWGIQPGFCGEDGTEVPAAGMGDPGGENPPSPSPLAQRLPKSRGMENMGTSRSTDPL